MFRRYGPCGAEEAGENLTPRQKENQENYRITRITKSSTQPKMPPAQQIQQPAAHRQHGRRFRHLRRRGRPYIPIMHSPDKAGGITLINAHGTVLTFEGPGGHGKRTHRTRPREARHKPEGASIVGIDAIHVEQMSHLIINEYHSPAGSGQPKATYTPGGNETELAVYTGPTKKISFYYGEEKPSPFRG